jgi:hypothetical protein
MDRLSLMVRSSSSGSFCDWQGMRHYGGHNLAPTTNRVSGGCSGCRVETSEGLFLFQEGKEPNLNLFPFRVGSKCSFLIIVVRTVKELTLPSTGIPLQGNDDQIFPNGDAFAWSRIL